MCLNETYSRGQVGKHLPDMSPITNGLNKEILYCIVLQFCFRICHFEDPGKPGWLDIKCYTSDSGLC